jgi:hypothetical protein
MHINRNVEAANNELPMYGQKPPVPGMYLGLLHGRNHPEECMNGWGFNGPSIGPLSWYHTTYAMTIRLSFLRAQDAAKYFDESGREFDLQLDGDLLVFNGKYYGDWTVYFVDSADCARPKDSFRQSKRGDSMWAYHKRSP